MSNFGYKRARLKGPAVSSRGSRGRDLEAIITMSQRGVVVVEKTEAGARFIGGGKMIRTTGLVDFVGTVCGSGRSIHFDAKQSAKAKGWYLSDLKPHQRDHLIRQGRAGAVAGLLCESTDRAQFLWIDWTQLQAAPICIKWEDATAIGSTASIIDFKRVPGVG